MGKCLNLWTDNWISHVPLSEGLWSLCFFFPAEPEFLATDLTDIIRGSHWPEREWKEASSGKSWQLQVDLVDFLWPLSCSLFSCCLIWDKTHRVLQGLVFSNGYEQFPISDNRRIVHIHWKKPTLANLCGSCVMHIQRYRIWSSYNSLHIALNSLHHSVLESKTKFRVIYSEAHTFSVVLFDCALWTFRMLLQIQEITHSDCKILYSSVTVVRNRDNRTLYSCKHWVLPCSSLQVLDRDIFPWYSCPSRARMLETPLEKFRTNT